MLPLRKPQATHECRKALSIYSNERLGDRHVKQKSARNLQVENFRFRFRAQRGIMKSHAENGCKRLQDLALNVRDYCGSGPKRRQTYGQNTRRTPNATFLESARASGG